MASLDYLRLASFEFNYASVISDLMSWWPGGWVPGRWLQYKGWKKESFFVGAGEQERKRHMIISASGSESDRLAHFMNNYLDFYCTRIDVQRTIKRPKHMSLRRIRKATDTTNTTLIESKTNDTLYVGSRASDSFTRLYEKPLDEMYLRLEFELKGMRARSAWGTLIHGKTPSTIFNYYLKKSKFPETVKEWYRLPGDESETELDKAIQIHSAKKKLKWLRSVDNCIEKAMHDHEIGEDVKELVRGWNNYADNLDKS